MTDLFWSSIVRSGVSLLCMCVNVTVATNCPYFFCRFYGCIFSLKWNIKTFFQFFGKEKRLLFFGWVRVWRRCLFFFFCSKKKEYPLSGILLCCVLIAFEGDPANHPVGRIFPDRFEVVFVRPWIEFRGFCDEQLIARIGLPAGNQAKGVGQNRGFFFDLVEVMGFQCGKIFRDGFPCILAYTLLHGFGPLDNGIRFVRSEDWRTVKVEFIWPHEFIVERSVFVFIE